MSTVSQSKTPTIGVLVLSHGTPRTKSDIRPFFKSILGGMEPTEKALQELERRYELIGGLSPLNEITQRQVAGIQDQLNEISPNKYVLYTGFKHISPKIEDATLEALTAKHSSLVVLVLTPHFSTMGTLEYVERVKQVVGDQIEIKPILRFWNEPGFADMLASRIILAAKDINEPFITIFSAHSLPEKILEKGDTYKEEHFETAKIVAEIAGLNNYKVGFQSVGFRGGRWLGPELKELLQQTLLEGYQHVLICPDGFVSDHSEILYDIDIELRDYAKAIGVNLSRTSSLNDNPDFLEFLARVIARASR